MPTRRDFIIERGGLEFHAIRYQPTNEMDKEMFPGYFGDAGGPINGQAPAPSTDKPAAPKGIPAMERVKSSSITEIGHDGSAMFIRYAAGNLYRFPGITTDQFKAARDAKSIGSHVNAFIIPKVKGIPVREQE